MSKIMKSIIEIAFRLLPIIAIAGLSYFLFMAPDSEISEGMKLSVSALLGAIVSYVFIQYSNFIEKIESRKAAHQTSLARLEFMLNDQLNWLSDVIYHLSNHEQLLDKVISGKTLIAHDGSTYRASTDIEPDIHNLLNLSYKNQLLNLLTSYKKIQNDIVTLHESYGFILNLALSDDKYIESYTAGVPNYLENTKMIRKFTQLTFEQTKTAISANRVLSTSAQTFLSKVKRYFVLQPDPDNYQELVNKEQHILEQEMESSKKLSNKELEGLENDITSPANGTPKSGAPS